MEIKAKRRLSGYVDMTEGSLFKNIVLFTLPLLLGNLFQQLYNMVDTWVIGQTGVNGAYAAVGSVGPVTNMLIGFFSGFATGAGVIISQYYGAKDEEKVRRAVHTSMALTLVLGVLFTAVGILLTPTILTWMFATEDGVGEVYPHAKEYLTIYFSGILALMIYNMGAGILRAVGDSQKPLYFLIVSAVTNTVLDLLFVNVLGMGVAGVAWATVISQVLSAVLVLIVLMRTKSVVRFSPKDMKIDMPLLGQIALVGFPSALQLALTAFSNIFVQSYIAHTNGVQEVNLSAWTTYSKIDQFIFLPMQSLNQTATTLVGQNLGRGNVRRAKHGTNLCFVSALVITASLIGITMLSAPGLAALFNSDAAVVEGAVMLLHTLTPFYMFCCINQIGAGALRGAGNSRAPMIIMLAAFVGLRQVYLYVMSNFISNELLHVGLGYPLGWVSCAVMMFIYYCTYDFRRGILTKTEPEEVSDAE